MPTIPPAPLDQAQLELSLAPFGSSRMLPRDAYLSADVLAWEQQHLRRGRHQHSLSLIHLLSQNLLLQILHQG